MKLHFLNCNTLILNARAFQLRFNQRLPNTLTLIMVEVVEFQSTRNAVIYKPLEYPHFIKFRRYQ